MLNLMKGCLCPQKNVYLVLALAFIAFNIGIFTNINMKNGNTNGFLQRFILNIIIIVLVYKLLEYLCNKKHIKTAWVISLLPLINCGLLGFLYNDCINPTSINIKLLNY